MSFKKLNNNFIKLLFTDELRPYKGYNLVPLDIALKIQEGLYFPVLLNGFEINEENHFELEGVTYYKMMDFNYTIKPIKTKEVLSILERELDFRLPFHGVLKGEEFFKILSNFALIILDRMKPELVNPVKEYLNSLLIGDLGENLTIKKELPVIKTYVLGILTINYFILKNLVYNRHIELDLHPVYKDNLDTLDEVTLENKDLNPIFNNYLKEVSKILKDLEIKIDIQTISNQPIDENIKNVVNYIESISENVLMYIVEDSDLDSFLEDAPEYVLNIIYSDPNYKALLKEIVNNPENLNQILTYLTNNKFLSYKKIQNFISNLVVNQVRDKIKREYIMVQTITDPNLNNEVLKNELLYALKEIDALRDLFLFKSENLLQSKLNYIKSSKVMNFYETNYKLVITNQKPLSLNIKPDKRNPNSKEFTDFVDTFSKIPGKTKIILSKTYTELKTLLDRFIVFHGNNNRFIKLKYLNMVNINSNSPEYLSKEEDILKVSQALTYLINSLEGNVVLTPEQLSGILEILYPLLVANEIEIYLTTPSIIELLEPKLTQEDIYYMSLFKYKDITLPVALQNIKGEYKWLEFDIYDSPTYGEEIKEVLFNG